MFYYFTCLSFTKLNMPICTVTTAGLELHAFDIQNNNFVLAAACYVTCRWYDRILKFQQEHNPRLTTFCKNVLIMC